MSFWSDPGGSISGSLNDLGSSVSNFVQNPLGTVGSTLGHWGDVLSNDPTAQAAAITAQGTAITALLGEWTTFLADVQKELDAAAPAGVR